MALAARNRVCRCVGKATVTCFPRPHFDGLVLTWPELAAGPDSCPEVPCALDSQFTPAGRSGLNPVTFCELAWYGITARGPQPADADVWSDPDALRAYTTANLRSYWRPWWQRNQQRTPLALAAGLSAWFPVWAVLGVSRLHHLLATGAMTSKCGAGRYALDTFGPRWQPIIAESLALRTGSAEGHRKLPQPDEPPPRHPSLRRHRHRSRPRTPRPVLTAPASHRTRTRPPHT